MTFKIQLTCMCASGCKLLVNCSPHQHLMHTYTTASFVTGLETSFNVSRPLLKHVVKAHDFHGSAGMHGRWRLQVTKDIAACITPKEC